MKKRLTFVLLLTIILIITVGCSGGKASFKDGHYDAKSEEDDNGYSSTIDIVVKDGKIDSVVYDELDENGGKKSEDEDYASLMKDVSGTTPAEAYEQLENALVKTQNPDKIDAVSGATGSSETFKKLAKEALDKAK